MRGKSDKNNATEGREHSHFHKSSAKRIRRKRLKNLKTTHLSTVKRDLCIFGNGDTKPVHMPESFECSQSFSGVADAAEIKC